jgi:acetolactate synthase-1/2/3 large subunit
MQFHEAIARSVASHGVSTVFGVLGDGNLFMIDSFERYAGGRFISVSNEAGGVLAANGYARTSGGLGVATVTHGPALTNTMTALVESVKDNTPILLLAGDTSVLDRDNLQNISQRDVVLCTGAGFEQVRSPQTVVEDVATAVRRAFVERRPVVLNIPADFQWQEIEYESGPQSQIEPQAIAPDPTALDTAVGIIASAKRPVVLAGRGATSPECKAALLRLAHRIGAPVATTLKGKDLFRGQKFNLGICGTLANPIALDVINQSDCIIAFGAGLNKWTTAEGSLLAKKQVVQVDVERKSIDRYAPVNAGIVGDAATVADTIVTWLDQAEVASSDFASDGLAHRLNEYTDVVSIEGGTEGTVKLEAALRRIERAFPANRTVVCDAGRCIKPCFTLLHVPHPTAYVHTINFGSIGLGMGNAIGASFGAPNRPVLLVCGDGGFMLGGLAEFNTAVRYGIDLVVVVLNDGAYGAEHIQFRRRNMDPAISTFDWPDFGPVATSLGGQGVTVSNLEELDDALLAIEARDRPLLIDIKLDPDE